MSCCLTSTKSLRKRWAPLFKTGLSSAADVYGDWVFYQSIALRETDSDIVDTYKLPIFVFFVVACVIGVLTLFSLLYKGCFPKPQNVKQKKMQKQAQQQREEASSSKVVGVVVNGNAKETSTSTSTFACCCSCLMDHINKILALEIILEDIPQFVLSAMVTYAQGRMTPAAVLNVTTSAYNFVFNIIDMIDPGDDNDENDGEEGVPLNGKDEETEA